MKIRFICFLKIILVGHVLDHMLDHIIIGLVITALQKSTLKEQKMEGDQRDLVRKSLDTGSRAKKSLSGHTLQAELFASELSSSLREVRFSEQVFPASKHVLDIKYHHPSSKNNNSFYLLND